MVAIDSIRSSDPLPEAAHIPATPRYLELPSGKKIPLEMVVQYVYLMLIQMRQSSLEHDAQHLQAEERWADSLSRRRFAELEQIAQKEDSQKLVTKVDHYRSAITSAAAGIHALATGNVLLGAAGLAHGAFQAADEYFGGRMCSAVAHFASSLSGSTSETWQDRIYLASSVLSIALCFGANGWQALTIISSLGQAGKTGVSHYIQWTAEQHQKSFAWIKSQKQLSDYTIDDASQKLDDATKELFKFYESKLKALQGKDQVISKMFQEV
jgi:hypothetical protein